MSRGARPKVTALVLSWNRKDEVLKTVELLKRSDYPNLEILIVDNGSTDGTPAAVEAAHPDVRVLKLPRNVGIRARDEALKDLDARYVAWFDDDSAPDPPAISRMVEILEGDQTVGCVAFDVRGGPFTTEGWAALPETFGFFCCGVGFRMTALREAGFTDPDFFLYSDDFDLAVRILNSGHRIVYAPDVRAEHRASAVHRSYKRLRTLATRNETWMALKYIPLDRLPRTVLRVLFWNMANSQREGPASVWYALRGSAEALARWRTAWGKRIDVRSEVLATFERHYWAFRPVRRTVAKLLAAKVRRALS